MPVYTLIFSKFYNRPSFLETLLCLIYSFFAIKRGTQCNALISFIAENIFFLLRQRIPAIYAPPSTQRIIIGLTATASKALLAIKQMTPTIDNSIANVKNSFQSISFQTDVSSDFALISARTAVSITVTKTVAIAGPIKPKT